MNFNINIKPQAKQSVRGGKHFYTDPKKVKYVKELKRQLSEQMKGEMLTGALSCSIKYNTEISKSWSKKKKAELINTPKISRPDLDNLTKPVLDAMSGIVYDDDSSVCELKISKYWAEESSIEINLY